METQQRWSTIESELVEMYKVGHVDQVCDEMRVLLRFVVKEGFFEHYREQFFYILWYLRSPLAFNNAT